ncbi:hypothetical protein Tco_0626282 [Tanacetum coccineum]|uniref:Uncharacterized protein n=1 Tax=Tanacetum coccineum TaxID=301880 RepID=A0ABQ4WJ59_9ASTR
MKDLVANKPRTEEDEEIRMNPRRLDFNNALADLGASISESYEEIVYRIIEVDKETYLTPKEKGYIGMMQFCMKKRMSASIGHLVIRTVTYVMEEMKIRYGKVCKMTRERILKDHWREKFREEEDAIEGNLEDLEECEEDKENTIKGAIHDKLNDDWLNSTSEDEDDLEGILDYLKPRSYDGFINLDNKSYNKKRCRLLGLTYEEPPCHTPPRRKRKA